MRILMITNLFPPVILGGYEIECRQIADQLVRRGHAITILTSDYATNSPIHETAAYPVVRALKLYAPFNQTLATKRRRTRRQIDQLNYRTAFNAIKLFKPDVAFLWSQLRTGMGPARACMKLHIPLVWRLGDEYLRGFLPQPWSWKPRQLIGSLLDHTLFHDQTTLGLNFDHVSAICIKTRDNLVAAGLPIFSAAIIYRGILLEQFPLKAQPGSLSAPPRLLYVGQLLPWKGAHHVIQAAHALSTQPGTRVAATLIGTGPDEYVQQLRQQAAGPAHIEFLGKVPYTELSKQYQRHDLFIFPSEYSEGFPSTYLEAMASGLPVISTDEGAQTEVLRHGENALLYAPHDPQQLVRLISDLIHNQELREKLATQGRKLVEKEFTLDNYVDKTEEFLLHAIRTQPS